MENEKSQSPTLPPNPSGSSTNYKIPTVEMPPVDIDRSQYQDLSKRTQPGSSTTSNHLTSAITLTTLVNLISIL
jgi:hypothetical protein